MALKAVVFDVGETLVDETHLWEHVADACGVPRFTLMALVGAAIARGESHMTAFELLGVEPPHNGRSFDVFYPDTLTCLSTLRERGLRVGAVGNMGVVHEDLIRPHVDFVASSERWGVEKPAPAFYERLVAEVGLEPGEIAYVGDRVDNDVAPARAAGLLAVHVRRGPWGYLHDPSVAHLRVASLAELPDRLAAHV